jgi:hypothetical protein
MAGYTEREPLAQPGLELWMNGFRALGWGCSTLHFPLNGYFRPRWLPQIGFASIDRVGGRFQGLLRAVLEHNLANLARIRDRARFGLLQVAASQRFKKAAVNVHPVIALQVIMCLSHVEHTGQHQPLHQLHQAPVAGGAGDDQMKVCIALNLLTVFVDAALSGLLCLFDDSLKLSKILFSKASETQLDSEQVESIDESENLSAVSCGPRTQIKAAGRPTLRNAELLKAVKCIADRRPAHFKAAREVFFAESLVGDKLSPLNAIQDSENNPVGECTIYRFGGETGRFVEQTQ